MQMGPGKFLGIPIESAHLNRHKPFYANEEVNKSGAISRNFYYINEANFLEFL